MFICALYNLCRVSSFCYMYDPAEDCDGKKRTIPRWIVQSTGVGDSSERRPGHHGDTLLMVKSRRFIVVIR